MTTDAYVAKSQTPELVSQEFKLLGANGGDLTRVFGPGGVTFVRQSEGVYLATWEDWVGEFKHAHHEFVATTPADLKGYTVVFEEWVASTKSVQFTVYNASDAAADLIAAQWILLKFEFARNSG